MHSIDLDAVSSSRRVRGPNTQVEVGTPWLPLGLKVDITPLLDDLPTARRALLLLTFPTRTFNSELDRLFRIRRCSRRCRRVRELIDSIQSLALSNRIKTGSLSRNEVCTAFGVRTKHEIATIIGDKFPELAPHVPPHRKCWMKEDDRMNIFDAMGFALTFFDF